MVITGGYRAVYRLFLCDFIDTGHFAIDGYQPVVLAIDLCDPVCYAFLSLIAITFHF